MNKSSILVRSCLSTVLIIFISLIVIIESYKYGNINMSIQELISIFGIVSFAVSFLNILYITSEYSDDEGKEGKRYKLLTFITYIQFCIFLFVGVCVIDALLDVYRGVPVKDFIEYFKSRGVIIFMLFPLIILNYARICRR